MCFSGIQGARVWVREKEQLLPATVNSCGDGTLVVTTEYGEVRNTQITVMGQGSSLLCDGCLDYLHCTSCTFIYSVLCYGETAVFHPVFPDQYKLLALMQHVSAPVLCSSYIFRNPLWHTVSLQKRVNIDKNHHFRRNKQLLMTTAQRN